MSERILIFQTFGYYALHLATELELIEKHAEKGDEVFVASCRGRLLSCDENIDHSFGLCARCRFNNAFGLRLVEGMYRPVRYPPLSPSEKAEIFATRYRFGSLEELQAFRIDNFDVGYAVLSTMISRYQNPVPDLQYDENLVRRLIYSALAMYRSALKLLDQLRPGRVYIYNGRYAVMRALLRACERRGIDYCTHDMGADWGRYQLFPNALPHDLKNYAPRMLQVWEQAEPGARERLGSGYFENLRCGKRRMGISYTASQEADHLPTSWDPRRRNVVVYTSSDDEFAGISPEWRLPHFGSQVDAMRVLAAEFEDESDRLRIYVRMHPNQARLRDANTLAMRSVVGAAIEVIPPESPVSSYACLQHADKVVTFGSTVGIEAVYWGKPSILAGIAHYMYLPDAVYLPADRAELFAMIRADLPPRSRRAALILGCFALMHGEPFRHYQPLARDEGSYRDTILKTRDEPGWLSEAARRFPGAERTASRLWMLAAKGAITGRLRW